MADLDKNCQQINAFDECFYLCQALVRQSQDRQCAAIHGLAISGLPASKLVLIAYFDAAQWGEAGLGAAWHGMGQHTPVCCLMRI